MPTKSLRFLLLTLIATLGLGADDWPMYKGNIYFTGNNDELSVKTNQIRWIFRNDTALYNPIVSDGRVYLIDHRANVICLSELTGDIVWKANLKELSRQFVAGRRRLGKIKYPIIRGRLLILSDSNVIYALNKDNGRPVWARTGMTHEDSLGRHSQALVDGIYSDPIISGDALFYGTRQVFMKRDLSDGRLLWKRSEIQTYSAFPTFYDNYIFTQSMDYESGKYRVYCLERESGKIRWQKAIEKPFAILAPMVYRNSVYIPAAKKLYQLSLENGRTEKIIEQPGIITSPASFTDREILFTINNQQLLSIDPVSGNLKNRWDWGEPSHLKYITIRDLVYIAGVTRRNINGKVVPYTRLQTAEFGESRSLWEFNAPFPGEPGQPVAAGGVFFLPAGNHLYALGKEPFSIQRAPPMSETVPEQSDAERSQNNQARSSPSLATAEKRVVQNQADTFGKQNREGEQFGKGEESDKRVAANKAGAEEKPLPLRRLELELNKSGDPKQRARVTVTKQIDDRLLYKKEYELGSGTHAIEIPDLNNVEITVESGGHLPHSERIDRKTGRLNLELTPLSTGATMSLRTIEFEFNRARLLPQSLPILKKIATTLKQKPGIKLEIQGHTDSSGPKDVNQVLSEKRAEAVRDYLVKQGVSPVRLQTRGFGESSPIAENTTPEGRAKNRRTEFKIMAH